ncbi:MAG: ATP-binding protein [Kofleriaceae bacterium]
MSDVTCKAVQPYFDVAKAHGVEPAALIGGMPYSAEFLRDKNNRISWRDFVEIGQKTRERCALGDADLEQIGRNVFKSGGMRVIMSLARVLGEPARFYKWMQRGNNMLFANMTSEVSVTDKQNLQIKIRLRDDDPPSLEYLLISKGGIASMPTLLGYPEAHVELQVSGPQAVFDVTMRPKRPSLIRRVVQAVRGSQETADELLATNEALTRRLEELSAANAHIEAQAATLDDQAKRLQLAHDVSKMIHGKVDVRETLGKIAEALLTHGGVTYVKLDLAAHGAHEAASVSAPAAAAPPDGEGQRFPIEIRTREVANLLLWAQDGVQLEPMLEYVLPVVAMAIDNALAFRELEAFQRDLQRLVDERTADLREARDDLAATVVQLQEVQGSRDAFFANISHEIRTPLSLIILSADDIERSAGAALSVSARSSLGSVVGSARKLLRLVDELLLLAAGEETKLRLRPEAADLGALIAGLVAAWRPAADTAKLTLAYDGPASLIATIDPVAIDRVVTNLVSNALKFTPSGGDIRVTLSADEDCVITVRDTGAGIDDELLSRLFGRFERSAAGGAKGGTGIGLSLVKQLTEAHGGKVSLIRPPSGGSEFRVELPGWRVHEAETLASSAEPRRGTTRRLAPIDFGVEQIAPASGQVLRPPKTSLGTVLLAEDDLGLSEAVARLLAEDYTVIIAYDGSAALELAREHQPHLLVTDVQMPGMNGIELAEKFRGATNDRIAPVVIMSALGDLSTRVRGLEAGAVDYVIKPFDAREFLARVRAQFRMRDLAARLHQAEQLSALGALSAGLAHELRNPANGVVNAIRPLRKLLPEELRAPQTAVGQLLEVALGCADQIGFLSRQLLNFRGGGALELREVPLAELVKRALNQTQVALADVEMRLDLGYEGEVRCAPQLLLQVLTNLLDNAAQAAGPGGWVEVSARTRDGALTIEVGDSGPGVPLELRERVFQPFFTTKPPGVGTGLGLPLSRDIAHRHGGRLELRERDGRCVFAIDLPV